MSRPVGRAGSWATTLGVSLVVVLVTLGAAEACRRAFDPGARITAWIAGALVATLLVLAINRATASRFVRDGVFAVSDGLLRLSEGDYGVRLAVMRDDEVGRLIRRFNVLAEGLRRDRSGIHQKEMLLETVLAASTTLALIVNEAGRVIYANTAAEQFLLGVGHKVEGQLLADLLVPAPEKLQEAVRAPTDLLFTCERPGVDDVETFHLSKHSFEISTRRHTLLLLKPLTKELARKEVETWKKAIRALSHEVNNSLAPITSLLHSARLMLANPAGHERRLGAALDTIEDRATHLKTFLDGYGSFARLPLPTRRLLPWRELLAGVEGLYPYTLEGALPESPVFADAIQMQQVLINLLKNAAESGSPPAEIAVGFDNERGGVGVSVQDRGKGMSPEVMSKALLPFYSTKKTGSGVGLALCREIIEAHGGRLSLHPRDGGGLVVRCWLPPAPPESIPSASASA
jgi:nitrogen fixation/metabolism regulation signal transduction histidine kinase